jgi:hypothetical protein
MDALREPGACAFCAMHGELERAAVQFIMSPAYMEDDVRRETNRVGFCGVHLNQMYDAQNRLGMALMLHTHLLKITKDLEKLMSGGVAGFFAKNADSSAGKIHAHFSALDDACYVCTRISATFDRYIDTFFYLWNKGGEAEILIKNQKGYCLHHFGKLAGAAAKHGRTARDKFAEIIAPLQLSCMQELAANVEYFTQKFDHRNAELPWNNAKDALLRAKALLGGGQQ